MAELIERCACGPSGWPRRRSRSVARPHPCPAGAHRRRAGGRRRQGYVVTFDEITELLSAQRKAAWADVARRIAHEIKNPLTPIQLSAERLRRKYLREITTIRRRSRSAPTRSSATSRISAAWSTSSRPSPACRRRCMRTRRSGRDRRAGAVPAAQRAYRHRFRRSICRPRCRRRRLRCAADRPGADQLLKNAVESIQGRAGERDGIAARRDIVITCNPRSGRRVVAVEDNGKGLPLQEPRELDRALCHDPGEGDRAWVSPSSRRSWKITMASWRSRIGSRAAPGTAGLRRRGARRRSRSSATRNASGVEVRPTMAHDILIVDDEADIRMLIAGILKDEGYETREAGDSDEALAAIRARQPTLVILDIWLQGSELDGIEILRGHAARDARPAGRHDQRPRHNRDRGRGDQDRRLRLHRKAVQVGSAAADRRARASRPRGCAARTRN